MYLAAALTSSFFFTALYLAEVAGYSGYQIALAFVPMTALMTAPRCWPGGAAGQGRIVQEVIHAAYSAFYCGLHAALFVAAALVLAAGVFTLIAARKRRDVRPCRAGCGGA